MSRKTRERVNNAAVEKVSEYAIKRARNEIEKAIWEILDCVDEDDEQPIRRAWEELERLIRLQQIQSDLNYRAMAGEIAEDLDNVSEV